MKNIPVCGQKMENWGRGGVFVDSKPINQQMVLWGMEQVLTGLKINPLLQAVLTCEWLELGSGWCLQTTDMRASLPQGPASALLLPVHTFS